jgi:hypothetical protein
MTTEKKFLFGGHQDEDQPQVPDGPLVGVLVGGRRQLVSFKSSDLGSTQELTNCHWGNFTINLKVLLL